MAEAINCSLFSKQLLRWTLFNGPFNGRCQLLFVMNKSDTATAAAINSFDHDWVTDFGSKLTYFVNTICRTFQCR